MIDCTVEEAFTWEQAQINELKQGAKNQRLLIWQPSENAIVLPAGHRWKTFSENLPVIEDLADHGWLIIQRASGGAPVPQAMGIVNISHIYHWPVEYDYSPTQAYKQLCSALIKWGRTLGVEMLPGATAGAYCDGDWNLNIGVQKVVGTAQRVLATSQGGKIVLAQAYLSINAPIEMLVEAVNQCYLGNGLQAEINPDVHTNIQAHTRSIVDNELIARLRDVF